MLKFIKDLARFLFTLKKGGKAEVATAMLARMHLGKDYKVHEHITLPTPDGTTQIDVLIISRYGIFVIEVKDYQGLIFVFRSLCYCRIRCPRIEGSFGNFPACPKSSGERDYSEMQIR